MATTGYAPEGTSLIPVAPPIKPEWVMLVVTPFKFSFADWFPQKCTKQHEGVINNCCKKDAWDKQKPRAKNPSQQTKKH